MLNRVLVVHTIPLFSEGDHPIVVFVNEQELSDAYGRYHEGQFKERVYDVFLRAIARIADHAKNEALTKAHLRDVERQTPGTRNETEIADLAIASRRLNQHWERLYAALFHPIDVMGNPHLEKDLLCDSTCTDEDHHPSCSREAFLEIRRIASQIARNVRPSKDGPTSAGRSR